MEHPIIFSTEMVKAIFGGRKTMTRRVVKDPRRPSRERDAFLSGSAGKPSMADLQAEAELCKDIKPNFPCPYGQVGDLLWVRESWRVESFMEGEAMLFSFKDGQTMEELNTDNFNYEEWYERVAIQSTEDAEKAHSKQNAEGIYTWDISQSPCRWRPSIFMPRWASRLTLEITEVRVERLQEITTQDVWDEGCRTQNMTILPFIDLWDSLNAKRGYGWDKNPWVWVIRFKVGG